MCEIYHSFEDIANHPKLTDDYKLNYFKELVDENEFCNWFEGLDDLGVDISSLGLKIEDLDNIDYMYEISDEDKNNLKQNSFSEKYQFRLINFYRYISTQYGPSNVGPNTRRFCRMLVDRTKLSLMRYEDIQRLNSSNPGLGKGGSDTYSVFDWRGGVNCRHIWVKYKYDTEAMRLVKAPENEQPKNVQVNDRVPYANGTNFPDIK